jgi:DNA repair protein SbcC/Rad50
MIIKQLQIQNFQSHESSVFDFDKGVNLIVGKSDSGKSAILRALYWLLFNRPGGEAFRSNWGGDTSVTLEFDGSGDVVERIRTKKENQYCMNGEDFKAIKTDVPVEIRQLLRLDNINFQRQLDGPFLLNEPPGNVARHFNKVANLDLIDRSISNVNGWISSLRSHIKIDEGSVEGLTEELSKYDGLNKLDEDLVYVERLDKHRVDLGRKIQNFKSILNEVSTVNKVVKENELYIELEEQVLTLNNLYSDVSELKAIILFIEEIDDSLLGIEDVRLEALANGVDNLSTTYLKIDDMKKGYEELKNLINSFEETDIEIKQAEAHLGRLEEKWEESMPDVCPLCGR